MKWIKSAACIFLLLFEALSASAIATPKKDPQRPPPEENPRNYFGYFRANYVYWIANREADEAFFSSYYATPTPTPEQGSVAYPPTTLQSGFKIAAGLKSIETEALFMIEYTWFKNNSPTGIFSYPNGGGYFAKGRTLTETSGGTAQLTGNYQRLDFKLVNYLSDSKNTKHFKIEHFFAFILAFDHQIAYVNSQNLTGASRFTSDQTWWSFGPEFGITSYFSLYKKNENQLYLFGLTGAGQGFSQTKSTNLETLNSNGNTIFTSIDSVSTASIILELEIGVKYSTENLEKNKPFFDCNLAWEFQTWTNNFSLINGPLWSLQGLTAGLAYTF